MKRHSVIIIGAGMAGVKTAIDLHEAGVLDTVILEARNRVGGRLVSHEATLNPKLKYDFGASWFHDALKNPLFEKAQKLGNVNYYFDSGKNVYISKEHREIPTWKFNQIADEITDFMRLEFETNPERKDASIRDMCDEYMAKYGKHLTAEQAHYAKQVVRMWTELWEGISWESASTLHSVEEPGHWGRNVFVTNGYATVFQNELDELPKSYVENNIKLNTHVKNIDWSDPNVVKVTTSTGETYEADYLVSTIPMSLLRLEDPSDKCHLSWTPSLPQKFIDIWRSCEYGSLGKVVLEFDECFWPKDIETFYVLADGDSSTGPAQPWKHPSIVVNYYSLTQTPSLVFLTQEPLSGQIEDMTSDEIWALLEPVLAQMATGPVRKPFKVHHTPWNKDEYMRGAYFVNRVNSIGLSGVCQAMTDGVSDRIRFAGAETMNDSSNGCAHGAWYSGAREAQHILRHAKAKSKF